MMDEPKTPPLTLATVFSRRDDIIASDLSETEAVMLNIDKGFYYGVEDVAKFMWDALDQPISVAEICDRVMAHFMDVERATCEEDALAYAQELLDEGLLNVHNAAPA
jgi:hypothetical protein